MKSLTDEVVATHEAAKRALSATGAKRMQAVSDMEIGFAKVHAHLDEIRGRMNL